MFKYTEKGNDYLIEVIEYDIEHGYDTDASDWDYYGYTDFDYIVYDKSKKVVDVELNSELVLKLYREILAEENNDFE